MRTTTITLNSIVAVFFACFVAYTIVARQHLDSLARRFVTEKTLHYSEPIVEIADQSLASPIVQKLLTDDQAAAIRNEIVEYRNDPSAYISDITREAVQIQRNQKQNPLLEKVASIKDRVRTFYDNTLAALIEDLRIFSTTNLCVGTIGLWLAYRSHSRIQQSIVWFSFLMFASVFYCSYIYFDDLTFFRILFRTHMGWWYPAFFCVVLIGLYLDYGRVYASVSSDSLAQRNENQQVPADGLSAK